MVTWMNNPCFLYVTNVLTYTWKTGSAFTGLSCFFMGPKKKKTLVLKLSMHEWWNSSDEFAWLMYM